MLCMQCFDILAQPARTEFVNKAPYPQFSLTEFSCPAADISLNGWVKSVRQTANIERLTAMPSGTIGYYVSQYQHAFDSTGNLRKYTRIWLCSKDTDVVFSASEVPSPEYLEAKHFEIDEEYKYSFRNGLLTSKKVFDHIVNSTTHYDYNEQGRLIREVAYYGFFPRITSMNLNENGQLVSVSIVTQNTFLSSESNKKSRRKKQSVNTYDIVDDNITDVFCYDAQGNCVTHLKEIYKGWRMDIYEYDDSCNLVFEGRCEKFNEKKTCDCQKKHINQGYEYDEQHHRIRDYSIGDWHPSGWDYYYQYDTAGRKIESKSYEIRGRQRAFTTHIIFSYDSLDRIVCKEALYGNFRINEAFVNYSFAVKQTWEYDAYGNILSEKAYVNKDVPFKVLKYTYKYDDQGNWVKRCRYVGDSEDSLEITETLERVISYYSNME